MKIHNGEVFVVAVFLEKLRQSNFVFGEKQIKEVKLNKTYKIKTRKAHSFRCGMNSVNF